MEAFFQLHGWVNVGGRPRGALELPADPGLTMITSTAEPGSASQEALDFLASWAATHDQPSRAETAQAPEEA
jgi:hypothetical protein